MTYGLEIELGAASTVTMGMHDMDVEETWGLPAARLTDV